MTRFNITLEYFSGCSDVQLKISKDKLFLPKLPSYRIIDVAKHFINCKFNFIGIRFFGEKIH